MMPNPAGLDQPERQVSPSVKSARASSHYADADLARKSTLSTAVAVPPLPRTSAATATCARGAAAARDPPYGRALAVPRSLAEGRGGVGSGRGGYLERQLPPGRERAAETAVAHLCGRASRPRLALPHNFPSPVCMAGSGRPRSVPSPKSRSPRDAQHPFLGDRHTEPPVAGGCSPAGEAARAGSGRAFLV